MKKLLVILMLALIPSLAFSASATVGGTLKVYVGLTAAKMADIIFPAQYVTALNGLSGPLINTDGAPAASGIPQVAPNLGQAGKVTFTGASATVITLVAPTTIDLTNAQQPTYSIIGIPVTYFAEAAFSTSISNSDAVISFIMNTFNVD